MINLNIEEKIVAENLSKFYLKSYPNISFMHYTDKSNITKLKQTYINQMKCRKLK